jgi:signal transduction histidine kinase
VAYVLVRDRGGRRLVGRSDDTRSRNHQPHPRLPIDRVTDGYYDLEMPVDLGARGRGTLQIGYNTAPLEAQLQELGSQAVRLAVMAFLAITLSAWLIGMWFGLRLKKLVPRIEALPRDPEGFRPISWVLGGDEISRLVEAFNRLGASLKIETQRRREVEREKQELSAMLVHDLKTPLTVIRSGVTLLQEQVGDFKDADGGRPRQARGSGSFKRTFELLEMSAQRLQRMVEDILQLARLEEVSGLRERAPVDMAAMARACAKDFEIIVTERRQKLALKIPKGELPPVLGDPSLLRRVMDNLLYNAVEHTPAEGTITLAVTGEGGQVRVSVADSGPGVPPEARADLFRKFFQRDLKRHVGNVGLGLALCEKVVRRHEGLIGIEDAVPRGACFYFTLPSAEPVLPLEAAAR